MSGLDLARKLSRGRHAQPVIIVTAYGSPDVHRDLRRAGVADCFSKPFPIDALRRSVRRALEQVLKPRSKSRSGRPAGGAGRRAA
jgi:FixJ family two-component response regulator